MSFEVPEISLVVLTGEHPVTVGELRAEDGLEERLRAGVFTIVDGASSTSVERKAWCALARLHHVKPVAVFYDDRSPTALEREGFSTVFAATPREPLDLVRTPLRSDRRSDRGPFDIIGDVHGCRSELEALLGRLGYVPDEVTGRRHPDGRRVVFLGDLVDRGPDIHGVLVLVMKMVAAGVALCVPGNHEHKLVRKVRGHQVKVGHGLVQTLAQLEHKPDFFDELATFVESLSSHYVLDEGRLVVAHAGLKEEMHGRDSGAVRAFALFGATTGRIDERGYPIRGDWAADYHGRAAVVYGHTPVDEATWVNNTICIDTGCVYGQALTALRYPERELVSVPAEKVWFTP